MNRGWIKFVILALVCSVAATGCKHKPKTATSPDVTGIPPVEPGLVDTTGGGGLNETPPGPGQVLTDPTTGQKMVVHFDYDSAVVTHDTEVLAKVGELLKAQSSVSLTIAGHCDERGSTEYNLSLGERRALAVRAYLVGLGIDGTRLTTQSFGEEQPSQPGHDDASWRENRRAEFLSR